jgi:tripartite ATP-independent transporter DctM subunit
MDGSLIALFGMMSLLVLLFIRMPVGAAMMLVGTVGIWAIRPQAALPKLAGEIFNEASNYSLTIIPLFVLMGNFATVSGMSRDLFAAAHSWFGHLRGGLASTTIVGCAGFSALSGSSLAAALTMGRVALPEMQRFNYDNSLATGTIAAGGTLGILIPPSAGFVIYAILTEESIGRLFMAGVVPGLLLTASFVVMISLLVRVRPSLAPLNDEKQPLAVRFRALGRAGWIIGIIVLTIGGIYAGIFSAIEAAGIGAGLSMIVTVIRGQHTRANISHVIQSTLSSTGTVFLILFGAFVFKSFIGFTGLAYDLSLWVESQGFGGIQIVVAFLALFIVLGMFMDGFAILVLTVPILQPILEPLGVDLIWFGVLMVIALEMGLISPPVGLNVFVVKGIAGDIPLSTIFRGIWPFWFCMLAVLLVVLVFPQLTLYLPDTMFG